MPWITIATNDQDARSGSGGTLAVSDLNTLCQHDGWATDALIDYGVATCDAYGAPLDHVHGTVLFVSPAVVKLAKDGDLHDFDDTLGAQGLFGQPAHFDTAQNLPGGLDVLLFPVNTGDTHWSLLAFYKSDRTFVHYDSLQPTNDDAARAFIARLAARGYLSAPLEFTTPPEVVRQQDGHNCGFYVIQFARMIMELGAKPDGNALARVTSESSDNLRDDMLFALQPLVAQELPSVDHRDVPDNLLDYSVPLEVSPQVQQEVEDEQLRVAVQKIQRQLETEDELPPDGVMSCPLAKPATVTVVLRSDDVAVHDLEHPMVTFAIDRKRFRRRATWDGKQWTTMFRLQSPHPLQVGVSASARPGPEFTEAERTVDTFELGPGEEKKIEFVFTPKPPRRAHAVFLFIDEQEHKNRPFPEGFKVEFVFDEGAGTLAATVAADGTIVSDVDGEPGVRLPYRYASVSPQFPEGGTEKRLTWEQNSDAAAPTALVSKDAPAQDNHRLGWLLPKDRWTPTARGRRSWTLPPQHFTQNSVMRRQIEVPATTQVPFGSTQDPLRYVLRAAPQRGLMNGNPIDHVVVLMMENRGFDHFMGYLYEGENRPKHHYPATGQGAHANLRDFEGMEGINTACEYDYHYEIEESGGLWSKTKKVAKHITGTVYPRRGARAANIPRTNPHEDFVHIFQDMYGKDVVPDYREMAQRGSRARRVRVNGVGSAYKVPAMNGWAQNFCDGIRHHRGEAKTVLTHEMVSEIMDMYLPDQLPVISGLARHYGVSDLWFCSVPSQTNTNRAFWAAGSAAGLVTNNYYPAYPKLHKAKPLHADAMPEGEDDPMFHRRSLFDVLEENGVPWKYYWSSNWPPAPINGNYFKAMFPQFAGKGFTAKVPLIDQFFKDVASGSLPKVSYIEPTWGGGSHWEGGATERMVGNEFHPVADMTCGEFFIKKIYDALVASPKWATTLFVITFDENGGTYDHMAPWPAQPTGREPKTTEFGFEFDCYGVRVPTLIISPHVKPETVFRSPTAVPFDHTSIISTILKWLDIEKGEWKLGDRVDNAPTFDGALEGTGDDDDFRRKNATGLRTFDAARNKRIAGKKPLQYGELFYLRYLGDKWAHQGSNAPTYLGGPVNYLNTWYPVCKASKREAMLFRFLGNEGPIVAGRRVYLQVASGDAAGYTMAMPESFGAGTIYLYQGDSPSIWVPWLVNDRVAGAPLYLDDEIVLFSERYLPENLALAYDPYQRLTVDRPPAPNAKAERFVKWRAGEWDAWKLEGA